MSITSAALVRRACFEVVGGFDPAYFGTGDWEMWWRICERWAAGFVDAPLTLYRVHEGNASRDRERIWRDDERLRAERARARAEDAWGRLPGPKDAERRVRRG